MGDKSVTPKRGAFPTPVELIEKYPPFAPDLNDRKDFLHKDEKGLPRDRLPRENQQDQEGVSKVTDR